MTQDYDDATHPPIILIGAGLAGTLLAIMLARRGQRVALFERRPDMRRNDIPAGRSINLALSTRGIHALSRIGLDQQALELALPMHGRLMHDQQSETTFQPYGTASQYINSISRHGLNALLLDAADREDLIDIHFAQRCLDVDLDERTATFADEKTGHTYTIEGQLIIGADGAYSVVRSQMQRNDRFQYQQHYIDSGYKELTIPPTEEGEFALANNRLHIWPRHKFMLIALPNQDRSFTCTLFLPFERGDVTSFEDLTTPEEVDAFFSREFPDAARLMPTLTEDFFTNPTGSMVTVRCSPFHHKTRAVLVGDAAHAIVPFYGQGMNAAFEDCTVFDRLVEEHGNDWPTVTRRFQELRKPNADAISELALYNFIEMRDRVASPVFLWRKRIEAWLHKVAPNHWIPLYTMVTFTNMPYAEARARAARQERIFNVVAFMIVTLLALVLMLLL